MSPSVTRGMNPESMIAFARGVRKSFLDIPLECGTCTWSPTGKNIGSINAEFALKFADHNCLHYGSGK